MSSPITTTIVINFEETEQGILRAEVDSRPVSEGGYNGGEARFVPGDSPVFLLYKTTNVSLVSRLVSDGTLVTVGHPTVIKTEQLQFANEREATLSYPYVSGFRVKRASPGIPNPSRVGNVVRFGTEVVGVLEVEYRTQAEAIRIDSPTGDLPVVVYVEGVLS